MWADTLLHAEQRHALLMLAWAASSIVAGTALYTMLAVRRSASPLLRHFGLQMLGWGIVVGIMGIRSWRALGLRDLAAATRLERGLWLAIGLEIGLVAVGCTLAATAWFNGRKPGGLGAGVGVMLQGLTLLVLDLSLVSAVSR